MPRRGEVQEHEWTQFELRTMLCLMTKGTHIWSDKVKKNDTPAAAKANAYLQFSTELNKALHGDNFQDDIPKKEVTKMLDRLLEERKYVVGTYGLMNRQRPCRITRTMRMVWESNRKLNYTGRRLEWDSWRKVAEKEKERAKKGLPASESGRQVAEQSHQVNKEHEYSYLTAAQHKFYNQALSLGTSSASQAGPDSSNPAGNRSRHSKNKQDAAPAVPQNLYTPKQYVETFVAEHRVNGQGSSGNSATDMNSGRYPSYAPQDSYTSDCQPFSSHDDFSYHPPADSNMGSSQARTGNLGGLQATAGNAYNRNPSGSMADGPLAKTIQSDIMGGGDTMDVDSLPRYKDREAGEI